MPSRIAITALLACLACGGAGTTQQMNEVKGAIAGQSFAARDATSVTGSWKGFAFSGTTLAVQLSDYANQCAYATKGQQPPDSQTLVLVLAKIDGQGTSTPPQSTGEFSMAPALAGSPGGLWFQAWYERGGSGPSGSFDCFRAYSHSAVSGKVVVTAITNEVVSGTFDLVLDTGDHLTGGFSAPTCAGLNLNNSPACP